MEVLIRVHARILRRRPASSVDARRNLRRGVLVPPFHEQGNSILSLGDTAQGSSRALRRSSRDPHRLIVRDHALADVDVVRIQVVRDIGVATRPRLEGLELAFGLAHVAVEVIEIAECASPGSRIGVRRVETLVVLDEDENAVFPGFLDEGQMVG